MSWDAFAEDSSADANHRGSFLNGYFKVVSHTHRQFTLATAEGTLILELISQLT